METPCAHCKEKTYLRHTEYGTLVCTACGVEDFSFVLSCHSAYSPYCVPLHSAATYTRIKRFRKYLQRASMQQSSASIPESTWAYLLAGQPYRGPGNIVRRLKKAPKGIRKKCYDSLPLLVKHLCPHLTARSPRSGAPTSLPSRGGSAGSRSGCTGSGTSRSPASHRSR